MTTQTHVLIDASRSVVRDDVMFGDDGSDGSRRWKLLLRQCRGGRSDGVSVHSLRVRGAVAHQEVILGNAGETLTIRHDMLDRAAAMPGLLTCVRAVTSRPGLTVGLEPVLGID